MMFETIRDFYNRWKHTAYGQAARDLFWSVLASGVISGGIAATDAVISGVTDPRIYFGLFYAGCITGMAKSISLFIKKYRDPSTLNTPY